MSRVFDGSGARLYTGDFTGGSADPCTLACWFKTDVTTAAIRALLSNSWTTDEGNKMYLYRYSTSLYASFRGGYGSNQEASRSGISTGTWYFAAAVFVDGNNRECWLGSSEGTDTGTTGTFSTLTDFSIGAYSGDYYYHDGKIAHACGWDSDIGGTAITSLAGGTNPLALASQPVVYYPFTADVLTNEGTGGATYDLTNDGSTFDGADNPTVDAPPGGVPKGGLALMGVGA